MSATLESALAFFDRMAAAHPGVNARVTVVVESAGLRRVDHVHLMFGVAPREAALSALVAEAADLDVEGPEGGGGYWHTWITTAQGVRFVVCLTDDEKRIVEAAVIARAFASAGAA